MAKNVDRMKKAIDEARKAGGEPPRPKMRSVVPPPPASVAAGPAKPSEEYVAVLAVAEEAIKPFGYVSEVGTPGLLAAVVTAIVRRFPGLTRSPRPGRDPYPARLDARLAKKGRLPAGSSYVAAWDGTAWSVTLSVPAGPPDNPLAAFHQERVTGDGLFNTLGRADDLYRQSLAPPPDDRGKAGYKSEKRGDSGGD